MSASLVQIVAREVEAYLRLTVREALTGLNWLVRLVQVRSGENLIIMHQLSGDPVFDKPRF